MVIQSFIEIEASASGNAHRCCIQKCRRFGSFLSIAGYSRNFFGGSYNIIIRSENSKTEEPHAWDSCHGGTLDTGNFLLDEIVYLTYLGILTTTCMEKFRAIVILDQDILIFFCLKR